MASKIPNYTPPQVTIEQQAINEVANTVDRNNAVVVGPAYTHADTKAGNLVWDTYAAGGDIDYLRKGADGGTLSLESGHTVNTDSALVLGQGLWLALKTWGTPTNSPTTSQFKTYIQDPTGTLLVYNNAAGFLDLDNPSVAGAFDGGRPPQAGDIYRVTTNLPDGVLSRKVTGLVGKDVAAEVSFRGYSGAVGLEETSGPMLGDLVLANFPTADDFVTATPTTASETYARQKGTFPETGGLRLQLEVTCIAAGDRSTAQFSARINGVAVAIANEAGSDGVTEFTVLTDMDVLLDRGTGNNAWTQGERFVANLDFATGGDLDYLAGGPDLTDYVYEAAVRRIESTVVYEVIAVAGNGDVTIRFSDTNGLGVPVTGTFSSSDTQPFSYDGVELELVVSSDLVLNAHAGMKLTARIKPPSRSTTVFDKVRLEAAIGQDGAQEGVKVEGFLPYTGSFTADEPVLGGSNFTAGADGVTLSTLKKQVSGYTLASDSVKTALDGKGTVAVQWQALQPVDSVEQLFYVEDEDDIVAKLGSSALESELGYGLKIALGSAGKGVYGLRTGGTGTAAFNTALKTLEATRYIYTIGVLTADEEVMKLFSAHANKMSAKNVKKFRRAYVGTDSPGEYPILSERPDTTPYLAKITAGEGGGFTLVEFTDEDVNLETLAISAGDKVLVVGTGDTYVIERRTGEKTLALVSGPNAPISSAVAMQIIAAETAENTGRYVWQRSVRLGANLNEDRRIVNVWTHNGVLDVQDGSPVVIPNRFLACEEAGYRVALLPQQSLTRKPVASITDAPAMYTAFTPAILDEMAANGVWIVTQDGPDLTPYNRHQLTTATGEGSGPIFWEDSAGVNFDFVCFDIDDVLDPLIGNRNVTRRTLVEVKNLLLDLLSDKTQADSDSIIGPQLAAFYDRNGNQGTINVEFDPNFKDRINVFMIIEIPLPLNNISVVVMARTIQDEGTTVNVIEFQVLPVAA